MKKSFTIFFLSMLFSAAHAQGPRLDSVRGLPFLTKSMQSVALYLNNPGDSTTITIRAKGAPDLTLGLGKGTHQLEFFVPEVRKPTTVPFTLEVAGKAIAKSKVDLMPVRKMTIYILPHSHNDIGYTEIQTNVERKQMNNLLTGIDYARRTKDYPAGARFVWWQTRIVAHPIPLRR